ncbi:MAG: sortase [Candidatus Microsaccharimonas sp.]
MNPDQSSPGGDLPTAPSRGSTSPPTRDETQNQAATNVIRSQISALYGARRDYGRRTNEKNGESPEPTQATQPTVSPQIEDTNPYERTHNPHPSPQADQWKEYHTAWQNYYQKYYESYYTHQVSQATADHKQSPEDRYFVQQLDQPTEAQQTAEELSSDQALLELRQKLLGRVQESASKIRHSRHFIPITAALLVVLIFIFLQYNRVFIGTVQAYVSPGSINPQNIVIDPNADVVVTNDPRLIIPKINVDVPVMYDVGSDYDSQMKAMETGVAHFSIPGASSHPGEIGNTAIAGHSSNDLFDSGNYKFIFAQLEKLVPGDSIYANYNGKRYTYVITKTEVVKPNEVNKLVYPADKPMLTLITCTPLGTATNRLLVTAEQISPDPASATVAPEGSGQASETTSIPGNSPTLLERLFGAR